MKERGEGGVRGAGGGERGREGGREEKGWWGGVHHLAKTYWRKWEGGAGCKE